MLARSKSMTTDAREGDTAILYAQPIKYLWVSIQPTKSYNFILWELLFLRE